MRLRSFPRSPVRQYGEVHAPDAPRALYFVDAEHALCNAVQNGRLLLCPACAAAIVAVLTRGTFTPNDEPTP